MPRLQLPSGRTVLAEICYYLERGTGNRKNVLQRVTRIRIITPELQTYSAKTLCSPNDNFSRAEGKERACEYLLKSAKFHKDFPNEKDRRTILDYFAKAAREMRERREKLKAESAKRKTEAAQTYAEHRQQAMAKKARA